MTQIQRRRNQNDHNSTSKRSLDHFAAFFEPDPAVLLPEALDLIGGMAAATFLDEFVTVSNTCLKIDPKKTDVDNFDINIGARTSDPLLMWSTIRPWAALNISCWDFLCDKAKWAEYSSSSEQINSMESQTYKLQVAPVYIKIRDYCVDNKLLCSAQHIFIFHAFRKHSLTSCV